MKAYDRLIDSLAVDINALPVSGQVMLFYSAAEAFVHGADLSRLSVKEREVTAFSLRAAKSLVANNDAAASTAQEILRGLDRPMPENNILVEYAWMCLDTTTRIIADPGYRPGVLVESILQPAVISATERLFGVSQIGSGPEEEAQTLHILHEPEVQRTVDFCIHAIHQLSKTNNYAQAFQQLRAQTAAIVPL
ncbi:MAG: hypothetical protein HXO54_01250 [Rothia dentocariosa]|nr:hypothetical protein [Rothia dentocariosa]